MHPNARLTSLDIAAIKRLLWDGDTHLSIANRYKVTDVHIGKIYRGIAYPDIEWPDGSTGAIPEDKRRLGRPRTIKHTNSPPLTSPGIVREIKDMATKISEEQKLSDDSSLLFNITGGARGHSRKEKT